MTLRSFLALGVCGVVAIATVPAIASSVSSEPLETGVATSIKVQRGVIDRVALATDPDTGRLLAVYEAKGRIYATVLKPTKTDGAYRGKKAKLISGKAQVNHRPAAIWDDEGGEWIVAWDTAPDSLIQLAIDLGEGVVTSSASDIHVRRVRARNGKPRGPEQVISEDSRLLIGPQLFVPTPVGRALRNGPVTLFNTGVEPVLGGDSLLRFQGWSLDAMPVKTVGVFAGTGVGRVGPPLPTFPGATDELALPLKIVSRVGNPTAHALHFVRGTVEYGDTTPAMFPEVDTRRPGLAPIGPALNPDGLLEVWTEDGSCFLQYVDRMLAATGPITRIADRCLLGTPVQGSMWDQFPGWTLGWSEGFDNGPSAGAAGTGARIVTVDPEGSRAETPTLMTTAKGVRADTMTVDPQTGRAWILWAEVRNQKRSHLWLEVVDPSPIGEEKGGR